MTDGTGTDVITIRSPVEGTVVAVHVSPGDTVDAEARLLAVEIMKMERDVTSPQPGSVEDVLVAPGDVVTSGAAVVRLRPGTAAEPSDAAEGTETARRRDLEEVRERKRLLRDEARPEAVRNRHERGYRTARENIGDLVDAGSFVEYGGLAIAAQRRRRDTRELIEQTPADGLVTGIATINAGDIATGRSRCAVFAYDYTVLAGTQGMTNHDKLDRILELADEHALPLVMFVEGGGGRPGDTDALGASWLDVTSFRTLARLSGRVPVIAVVNGYCFAGNAALAGCADVIVATEDANLGMAGPAMIEGGGLGSVAPGDIGPTSLHASTGVVDVVVADEREAAAAARRVLGYFQGALADWTASDQQALRTAVPENRKKVYDVRPVITTVADTDSVLEVRRGNAPGMVTALARVEGRPVGILANDPSHLGGAIDASAADSAARFLGLCDVHGLPVIALCDTPGFMVGPEAERDAGVRRFGRLFVAGANLRVPLVAIVLRKAYGLGAQALMGGHLRAPAATLAWPTAELGPMGLEGAVRLGFRRELEAAESAEERDKLEGELIDLAYANAKALNVATYAEIDDVIDPVDTRERIVSVLDAVTGGDPPPAHRFVDPW